MVLKRSFGRVESDGILEAGALDELSAKTLIVGGAHMNERVLPELRLRVLLSSLRFRDCRPLQRTSFRSFGVNRDDTVSFSFLFYSFTKKAYLRHGSVLRYMRI